MAEQKPHVDFEKRDIEPALIVRAAVIVVVVSLVAIVAVLGLLNFFGDSATQSEAPSPPLARHEQGRLPPAPRLQEQPFKDIGELYAEEQALLGSSGWVDQQAGIARIPVDEAMQAVLEKGLPVWPKPSPTPGAAGPGGAR